MNLDQIATKCFILALFIRDDGQRLLLGDGYYGFNQKLQHFQANTIANDIVEIQGDNGQLLAGQVMRSGAQKFEGYIGDATTSRQIIEQKRSDFMAFFRIKHLYKVIYIFPDGTAIQRQRGYLTDAPTIPEIFQKFPEYSVALNFEDANYYEYAEDEHGDEIYAHIAELALAGGATGGLIWDAIGAVTNGITWSGIQTAQGEYIQITNELSLEAPLASVEMLGKAEQDGTPTPDSPVPIEVVAGENTVKIEGKNLCYRTNLRDAQDIEFYFSGLRSRTFTISFKTNETLNNNSIYLRNVGNTQWHNWGIVGTASGSAGTRVSCTITLTEQIYSELQDVIKAGGVPLLMLYKNGANFQAPNDAQIELGSTATAYEPYQGQEFEVNLGKNLLDIVAGTLTDAGVYYSRGNGTASAIGTSTRGSHAQAMNLIGSMVSQGNYPNYGTITEGNSLALPSGTYTLSATISNTGNTNGGLYIGVGDVGSRPATGDKLSATGSKSITLAEGQRLYLDMWYEGATSSNIDVNLSITNIQLEKGSTATSFAPYFAPIELAKIGNYQDRIYKDSGKWYIEKQVGKVVLDGTESTLYATSGTSYAWSGAGTNFVKNVDFLTNYASTTPSSGTRIKIPNNNLYFYDSGYTSLDNLKTALASTNLVVYAPLATPTTTEITNQALIAQLDALGASSLYLGVNNIGTETQNAMPTLKIEYYTEVGLDGAGYEWEPGGNTAKTIVTVAGVDSAWPIWTVQGGAQNPTLTNITTGQTISWQGFVPEGQTLTINMAEMTADLAGANVFEYITGEWLRLAPGNNTLVYNAGNADKPSTLSWNGVLA